MESDDILVQIGGFALVKGDEFLFSKLEESGLIRRGQGSCKAVAIVTDAVRPGVLYSNFLWAPGWPGTESNSLIHRVPDPITNRYRFKLGKATIRKIGRLLTNIPSTICPSSRGISSDGSTRLK